MNDLYLNGSFVHFFSQTFGYQRSDDVKMYMIRVINESGLYGDRKVVDLIPQLTSDRYRVILDRDFGYNKTNFRWSKR